jgi:spore coat protein U domain-containing protein, fimbrial subunit CupE1/2/3/6
MKLAAGQRAQSAMMDNAKWALRAAIAALSAAALDAAAVTCTVSTPGLAFGGYDVFAAAATNGNGTLTLTCSLDPSDQGAQKITPYSFSLSTGSSGSFVQRTMKSGSNALGYNLYTSNTYAVVWGDGTGSTSTMSGTLILNGGHPTVTNTFTVYGRVPALQDAAVAADYRDNVTATVTY